MENLNKQKAYILSGIPRSYTGFNGSTLDQIEIAGDTTAENIQSLTSTLSFSVFVPRDFDGAEHLSQRNWISLFLEETAEISRVFTPFRLQVYRKFLQKKIQAPLCGKCLAGSISGFVQETAASGFVGPHNMKKRHPLSVSRQMPTYVCPNVSIAMYHT